MKAKLKNTTTGKIVAVHSTTDSLDSSYGFECWVDDEGNSYGQCQFGAPLGFVLTAPPIPTHPEEKIGLAQSLEELGEIIDNLTEEEQQEVDFCALPTFGGPEPDDTEGLWSWDETEVMISWGDGFKIVDRDDPLVADKM